MCKSLGGSAGRAGPNRGNTHVVRTVGTDRARPRRSWSAPDTWILHSVQEATGAPLFVYLNSMVIRGSEPVIIDTSTPANREQFLEDVFGLVEPEDVKWVFLSHDDVDHTGNLEIVMDRCPNATLVSSWAITERHSNTFDFPLDRCRWINDGGVVRRRRPHAPRGAAAAVRLADDARPLRRDHRRLLGRRLVRVPDARWDRGVGRRLRRRALAQRDGDVHVPRAVAVAVDRRPEEATRRR